VPPVLVSVVLRPLPDPVADRLEDELVESQPITAKAAATRAVPNIFFMVNPFKRR